MFHLNTKRGVYFEVSRSEGGGGGGGELCNRLDELTNRQQLVDRGAYTGLGA